MNENIAPKYFKEYLDQLVTFIDSFPKSNRNNKIDTKYCLEQICYVLSTGISWNHLRYIKCHYTTIYKRFVYWTKLGIFEKFWNIIITEYIDKQLFLDPLHFKTIYIDCSMIKNNHGRECTGPNHMDRFRKSTKVSMICDKNKVPLVAEFVKGNIADSNTIEQTLDSLKILRLNNRFNNYLAADKGYIIDKERFNNIYNITRIKLIAQRRRNQKHKLKPKEEKHLLDRYKIENTFCRLDKFSRIKCRNESSLDSYKSFNYMAMIVITIPFI